MKLKKYKEKTVGVYLSREIIMIVLGIIIAIIVINHYYKKFNNAFMSIAEAKTKS